MRRWLALHLALLGLVATRAMLLVNDGRDMVSQNMLGGAVGYGGTATATGATSMTDSGAAWGSNVWAGYRVVCGSVWANVISNTGTVLTVDRWYVGATPGGAAASTPGSTATYLITDGGAPAWFMGLTANATSPAASDTSLTAEITTASGGLVRKIAALAHSAGATTSTLTAVFTANGSDSLPVTIAKIGIFRSMVVADTTKTMLFETLLSSTATLSASGDALTATDTISVA